MIKLIYGLSYLLSQEKRLKMTKHNSKYWAALIIGTLAIVAMALIAGPLLAEMLAGILGE